MTPQSCRVEGRGVALQVSPGLELDADGVILGENQPPGEQLLLVEPQVQRPSLVDVPPPIAQEDRKSTRLNSSHLVISYAVFCLKKKKMTKDIVHSLRISI